MGHGVAEIVVDGDGFDDTRNRFGAEGGDAGCDDHRALLKVLTQGVVERANLFDLADHDCLLEGG
jgi:hypothetical protein